MDDKIKGMASLLKLVSDPTRLVLLACLKQKECCVCELVEHLGISQPGVSQHLRKLKKEKIILERKEATWIYYRLNSEQEPYIEQVIVDLPSIQMKKGVSSSCVIEG